LRTIRARFIYSRSFISLEKKFEKINNAKGVAIINGRRIKYIHVFIIFITVSRIPDCTIPYITQTRNDLNDGMICDIQRIRIHFAIYRIKNTWIRILLKSTAPMDT